jgi:rhamnose utilization protein RhaD (predicted bifunctional aldolase and dehydrogenase)
MPRPPEEVLDQLVRLSNRLGDPRWDCAILGEGNTSARVDDETFLVKASGCELGSAGPAQFVRVRLDAVLDMLDAGDLDDAEIERRLADARVHAPDGVQPSVETVVHAVCLGLDGVDFVGHTHPTAINAFTCSQAFEEALGGRLFPDEIVLCGPRPVLVPYVDPGLPLARAIRDALDAFVTRHGEIPRTMYLQNHGFFAFGATPRQVEDTTAMAVKAARILAGTCAFGGPRFLPPVHVDRIHRRPDEDYRKRVIEERARRE